MSPLAFACLACGNSVALEWLSRFKFCHPIYDHWVQEWGAWWVNSQHHHSLDLEHSSQHSTFIWPRLGSCFNWHGSERELVYGTNNSEKNKIYLASGHLNNELKQDQSLDMIFMSILNSLKGLDYYVSHISHDELKGKFHGNWICLHKEQATKPIKLCVITCCHNKILIW